ncbi:MAG: aminopeptidase [Clostridia bacterium]|nr:aminopeptidase [Clostridia bacterium]
MDKLEQNAKKLLTECMGANKDETCLIVCDDSTRALSDHIYNAAKLLKLKPIFLNTGSIERSGQEPPKPVAEAMKHSDIVMCLTKHSITHTKARRQAAAAGARIATMPGITEDMFLKGAITADYKQVEYITDRVAELLDEGKNVLIEKDGFKLKMCIDGRKAFKSTGRYLRRGESGNLPSGEAYIAPLEGSAQGEILVDGSIADIGKVISPIVLEIKDGLLQDAKGGEQAKKFLNMLGDTDKCRNVAELGIGTNPQALLTGNTLEDEKKIGTIHIAFGSNDTFGGNISAGVHIDCIILSPNLYIDDFKLMDNGILNYD